MHLSTKDQQSMSPEATIKVMFNSVFLDLKIIISFLLSCVLG